MTAAETMGMELAYQIQKRLYENSLTAEVFAKQCGVPEELVAQAMEEESIPIEAVQKICDTLGISVDSLRRMPVSGNFVELQQLVLDIIQERPAACNSLLVAGGSRHSSHGISAAGVRGHHLEPVLHHHERLLRPADGFQEPALRGRGHQLA